MAEGGREERATGAAPAAPGVLRAHSGAPDVFISYASPDRTIADAACGALERAGVTCWIAPRDVVPGEFYADAIVRAIDSTKVIVLVLSENAAASPHVLREVERASSKRHPIVSLRIDLAPPPAALEYFLNTSHWLDASASGVERAWPKLVHAVQHLVAPVSTVEPMVTRPTRRLNRPLVTAGALIAFVVVFLAIDKFWLTKRAAAEKPASVAASPAPSFTPPPHSIAVLPFVNMSGDAKQDYFSDGISEELLDALSRVDQLQVAARTSSFSFKGQNADVSTIARKLNVGAILEGSVRRAGNTVRITVQLINATSGFHTWSQTYDRNLSDILKVQKDVATSVARQLQITLAASDVNKVELGGTSNAEAYDAFLRGAQMANGANGQGATLRDALAEFDRAIALDPNYAKAHAKRAWMLHSIAVGVRNPDARARPREQARVAAERAVALAPDLGEAHAALASIRAYALFDYVGAAPEFERALALAPGNAEVQQAYAWYAADLGHFESAIGAARRGVSLDPQNPESHAVLGVVLTYARRYSEALAAFQDFWVLRPGSHAIGGNRAQTLLASGQTEQAMRECESPATPMDADDRHQCLALAYHVLGRQADAEGELAKLRASDGDSAAYTYAGIYSQWGNAAVALQWLAKAEKLRDPWLWLLRVDWQLDPIRDEPQFKAIVARMNFPP